VLTLILLGLLGGSGWYGVRQRKRARKAEAQLKRIACTDDEVMAVLEASSGPLAERLLLATRSETSRGVDERQWRSIVSDLKMHSSSIWRMDALRRYVEDGLLVTESQYLRLLKLFGDSAVYQDEVRKLLRKRRVERVKRA
jgi:hypothetical protein